MGKTEPPTSPRVCLKCSKTFDSTGPGNRICPKCTRTNKKYVALKPSKVRTGKDGHPPLNAEG